MSQENIYRTIDIERRGFGRRYTWLPVDSLSRDGFVIDCTNGFLRPDMYDIRPGDIVRWREGERLLEGTIADIQREGQQLTARVEGTKPLPAEAFYP